jgi:cyanate lyase
MASTIFSKAVLLGLSNEGFSSADVSAMTGLTPAKIKSIALGKSTLTDKNVAAIERATGLTGGQLAVRSEKSPDPALRKLMDGLASARPKTLTPASSPR